MMRRTQRDSLVRGPSEAYAMISFSLECCGGRFVLPRQARRMSMTALHRSGFFLSFFGLIVAMALAKPASGATVDDSAKAFADRIAEALPTGATISFAVRNVSSLAPAEQTRIEEMLKSELQQRGLHLDEASLTTIRVTLAENWKDLVWTAEIRSKDAVRTIVASATRNEGNRSAPNSMHVTVRGERFWEGPERVLDALEISSASGRSWLVLLADSNILIEDLQSGGRRSVDIAEADAANRRDPWGVLAPTPQSAEMWFQTPAQTCKLNLETSGPPECLSKERVPILEDLAPAGPLPRGIGTAMQIPPVCGSAAQFLATSARDYTQTDFLQVFQSEPAGPVAVSGELNLPGPIIALHGKPRARAVVKNLATGNYEAYRLAISCGE